MTVDYTTLGTGDVEDRISEIRMILAKLEDMLGPV